MAKSKRHQLAQFGLGDVLRSLLEARRNVGLPHEKKVPQLVLAQRSVAAGALGDLGATPPWNAAILWVLARGCQRASQETILKHDGQARGHVLVFALQT